MNNIQMKNEIPDSHTQTVKLVFGVTFESGTSIETGTIVISRADWLNMTGQQKLDRISDEISKSMLSTKVGEK
ncbi:hypothetical protein IRM63_03865 [Leuconostoc citreum]|uniref:hypothetical protein n=1 Tax=Leuconostoc citreum TaxID=33964 RepID=UPI0018896C36|nr:hypothetical protein [Leuconostoc citreum]QOY98402.1 hypothetical protein IRM63_03865 [Leuconostoc citreum]